jgi:2-polyprenyl-3-methyl-5-hydroxy-6-metoxy-1,4-benzoquinol methylase
MNVWSILDQPRIWETTRWGLDLSFGLYRRRIATLRGWGVLTSDTSVLDVGCGIGSYASLTTGRYLGVDMNPRYIDYARRRQTSPNASFRCASVDELVQESMSFDIVLMVDVLHHLTDEACQALLVSASHIARTAIVSFEPVLHQTNPMGQWIIDHDRGDYIRPLAELHALFSRAGLALTRSQPLRLGPILTRAALCAPAPVAATAAEGAGQVAVR